MANFSETQKINAWQKATQIIGQDENKYRFDACNAIICWTEYGQDTTYGWTIDHILPIAKGGDNTEVNLRAFHFRNNLSKSDDFPNYKSVVTSQDLRNIDIEDSKTINEKVLEQLKQIYLHLA